MKKRTLPLISLAFLLLSFVLIRFLLLPLHGMKEFPVLMAVVGVLFIAVSGLIGGEIHCPMLTALGYLVGFFGGKLFSLDTYDQGHGRQNNLWIIWLCVYAAAIVSGAIIDLHNNHAAAKKQKKGDSR